MSLGPTVESTFSLEIGSIEVSLLSSAPGAAKLSSAVSRRDTQQRRQEFVAIPSPLLGLKNSNVASFPLTMTSSDHPQAALSPSPGQLLI